MDGDGDVDLIAIDVGLDKIVWYRNTDGIGTYSPAIMVTNQTDGPLSLFSADIDGDGAMDILSASFMDNKVAWYRNTNGQGDFGAQQIISNTALSARAVFAADFDGDGDMDVLAGAAASDKVIWFENMDGLGTFGPEQVLSANANGVESVFAIDIDGDGDMDALSGSGADLKVAWYENMDGLGTFSAEKNNFP